MLDDEVLRPATWAPTNNKFDISGFYFISYESFLCSLLYIHCPTDKKKSHISSFSFLFSLPMKKKIVKYFVIQTIKLVWPYDDCVFVKRNKKFMGKKRCAKYFLVQTKAMVQ